jgi:hypothetical protein
MWEPRRLTAIWISRAVTGKDLLFFTTYVIKFYFFSCADFFYSLGLHFASLIRIIA